MTKQIILSLSLIALLEFQVKAQQVLSKEEAIKVVMENNFDIIISRNNIEVAKNNTSIYNSGYLPTLTGSAAINYNKDNLNVEFQDGSSRELKGATSNNRNAGLNLNYVLFDGFNRKYNMERNIENLNLSQLSAQVTLESVLLNLFTAYYNVARNQQTIESLKETLKISKDRLLRTKFGFDYGRNSKLDVSNAEVDVNTDSINYLNAIQSLGDAQRNLNLILGKKELKPIQVDTALLFIESMDKPAFRESLLIRNTNLLVAKSGVSISQLDSKVSSTRYLPTLSVSGGYNYRLGNNNSASFTASNSSSGVTGGLSLGWNIFDGGATKTAVQNAKINESNQKVLLEQTQQQTVILFENAWNDYNNKMFIARAQQNNLRSNELNFDRTKEQYKLGQVTSLEFRTSQSNLLSARTNLINALYEAKLAELLIFQLAGKIQEAAF